MSATQVVESSYKRAPLHAPGPHQWTRAEYYRLVDNGFLGDTPHVELIEGEIIDKVSPQLSQYSTAIRKVS